MAFREISQLRGKGSSPLEMIRKVFRRESSARPTGITIVSAYTDPALIGHLLKDVRKAFDTPSLIRIFLDKSASGYHRDADTTSHLDRLARRLSERQRFVQGSGIFLVSLGRFMHSKIIVLHESEQNHVSIGSLNFTYRGFFGNEEIQAHLEGEGDVQAVLRYLQLMENSSRQIPFPQGLVPELVSSPREWLLNGRLFFEDRASNPYNFKLGLPERLLRQPAYIIPGAEAEVSDNISILSLLDIPRVSQTARWKRYCIATCYGYWCPAQLVETVQNCIAEAVSAKREAVVNGILQNADELKSMFLEIFDQIDGNIKRWNQENGDHLKWERQRTESHLDRWLPRVLGKLRDPRNVERLLAGVDEAVVPDLWAGDEIALKDFEESFCAHIVIEMSKSKVINWVAQWLCDYYEFKAGIDLHDDWDNSWDDDEAWLAWLRSCRTDPFAEMPREWDLAIPLKP